MVSKRRLPEDVSQLPKYMSNREKKLSNNLFDKTLLLGTCLNLKKKKDFL